MTPYLQRHNDLSKPETNKLSSNQIAGKNGNADEKSKKILYANFELITASLQNFMLITHVNGRYQAKQV